MGFFIVVNVVFRWNYEGNEVYVTGTFTNWQKHIKLQKTGNEFSVILPLARGVHRYKFIVDDEWRFSPDDTNSPDENGNINNVIDTTDYTGQNSFNYPAQSSISTTLRFLNNTVSTNRAGTMSTDIKNSTTLSNEMANNNLSKFFEDEMEFVKEAPPVPPQMLDIYFISVSIWKN